MSTAATSIADSVGLLATALDAGEASEWDVALQQTLEMLIDLISDGDAAGVNSAYEAIDHLEAEQGEAAGEKAVALGQIRVLALLSSLAAMRPGRAQVSQLARRECNILWALDEARVALDNGEIVARSGHPEAVVSRALRQLRAAGLVTTRQEWRRKLSELTERGRQMVKELPRPLDVRREIAVTLAKLQRFDAGPADVWAMAQRVGADVLSTAAKAGGVEPPSLDVDGHEWRISVSGQSEEQTRLLVAQGLGRLAVLSEFPVDETKHARGRRDALPGDTAWDARPDDPRKLAFENIYSAAKLMPELPTVQLFIENGDPKAVALRFNVPEDFARRRLETLGLYPQLSANANEPQSDFQPSGPDDRLAMA